MSAGADAVGRDRLQRLILWSGTILSAYMLVVWGNTTGLALALDARSDEVDAVLGAMLIASITGLLASLLIGVRRPGIGTALFAFAGINTLSAVDDGSSRFWAYSVAFLALAAGSFLLWKR